ncbi:hypothetical protein [Streptomyces sp. NBC_01174]|uniref:hypothetical protein n=1 Tax=Streptomyces sp. NBC_01174 TaxID=2903758 RepID=UPI002F90A74B|nr:hypothetical protein OG414_40965 [Streptomyces sp. NBC_01174]
MTDMHQARAERGAAIVALFQRDASADQALDVRVMRALCYVSEVHATDEDPLCDGLPGLRDALVDLLHHADGWHYPEDVLGGALSITDRLPAGWAAAYRAYDPLPRADRLEMPGTSDPHELSALVGAATEILMAAAAQYEGSPDALVDEAEERFLEEREEARFAAIREARS